VAERVANERAAVHRATTLLATYIAEWCAVCVCVCVCVYTHIYVTFLFICKNVAGGEAGRATPKSQLLGALYS